MKAICAKLEPALSSSIQRFHAKRGPKGEAVNYGVFVLAGEAAGLYARVQAGVTDDRALSAPVVIAG